MSRLLAGLFLGGVLAACSAAESPGTQASGGGAGKGGTGGSTGGSGAVGGGNTGGSSGSGASGGSGGELGTSCETAELGAPTLRLLTRREFENTIGDIFPSIRGMWTNSLPSNFVNEYGFENSADNVVGNQLAAELLDTAESIGSAVTGAAFANILPCSTSGADRACAQTFLDQYGQRLFRRPLTAAESARYLSLFDTGLAASDFATAMKWVVAGLVQSPHAAYRSELGVAMGDGSRKLTGHELATQLAYTFGGTTPSQALLDQYAENPATDPAATARTLLATEGGKEVVQHFFEAYLDYTGITATLRNVPPGARPFTEIGPAMVKETRSFIADIVMVQGLGLRELLTAPTTNPSATLADFYGFPRPATENGSVMRPAGRGIGLLAQGSFLASHANTDASSPTLRGLFPYYRLLCQPKQSPPQGVPMISTAAPTKTTRERYEVAHMQQGTGCNGCHMFFDPIGFGFEHFDQVGVYRAQENGVDVDSVSYLPDPETGEPLFQFTTQEELVTGLAALPESFECFSAYLATYAFGSAEACLGASQVENMQAGTTGILEAYALLAAEPHFSRRDTR